MFGILIGICFWILVSLAYVLLTIFFFVIKSRSPFWHLHPTHSRIQKLEELLYHWSQCPPAPFWSRISSGGRFAPGSLSCLPLWHTPGVAVSCLALVWCHLCGVWCCRLLKGLHLVGWVRVRLPLFRQRGLPPPPPRFSSMMSLSPLSSASSLMSLTLVKSVQIAKLVSWRLFEGGL